MKKTFDLKDWVEKHNNSIKDPVGFLVITAGAKKKRRTIYYHKSFKKKDGSLMPSKYDKYFDRYIVELSEIKDACKDYPKTLVLINVLELSTDETADVPLFKFIRFGKYAKTNIDEIAKKDPSYCLWLIKNSCERKLRKRFEMTQLDEYIMSPSFKSLVFDDKSVPLESKAKDVKVAEILEIERKLEIELIPKSSWYSNLRSVLTQPEWDIIRRKSYKSAGYLCQICGCSGKQQGFSHPVECHEQWEYKANGVQKLIGLITLCPLCHKCKHIGLNGGNIEVQKHLSKINGFVGNDKETAIRSAFKEWEERNKINWKLDISYLTQYDDYFTPQKISEIMLMSDKTPSDALILTDALIQLENLKIENKKIKREIDLFILYKEDKIGKSEFNSELEKLNNE